LFYKQQLLLQHANKPQNEIGGSGGVKP